MQQKKPINLLQTNLFPSPELLPSGSTVPLLSSPPTDRITGESAAPERENKASAKSIIENLPTDSSTAAAMNRTPTVPTIRLLGSIKSGMPGEIYAVSGECPRCRTLGSLRDGETLCPVCLLPALFKNLIREHRLASEMWESIRRTLHLPTEIKNYSLKQARAILQLIEAFAKCYSFAEQEEMLMRRAVGAALIELPGLPPLFRKSLKRFIKRSQKRGKKRQPISACLFTAAAARQGSFCYWCGIRVIRQAAIPPEKRVVTKRSTVVYLTDTGKMREESFATIDHLIRVTDGGDNRVTNLVISCAICNQARDTATQAFHLESAKRRAAGGKDGGRFYHPEWGCCSICRAIPERAKNSRSRLRYVAESIVKIVKKLCER